MNVTCHDRERILRDAEPAELRALALHAAACDACRAELALWNEISAAAPLLRKDWDDSALWPRIHQRLAEESVAQAQAAPRGTLPNWWQGLWNAWAGHWKPALAAVALLVLTVFGVAKLSEMRNRQAPPVPTGALSPEQRLLSEQALREIEKNEAAYAQSIEKLSALVAPQSKEPETPLQASYREKLTILDAAIADLRAQAERNRYNAHLRRELLALYQEKQRTLQELAQGEGNVR